jgi:hypothetical protein
MSLSVLNIFNYVEIWWWCLSDLRYEYGSMIWDMFWCVLGLRYKLCDLWLRKWPVEVFTFYVKVMCWKHDYESKIYDELSMMSMNKINDVEHRTKVKRYLGRTCVRTSGVKSPGVLEARPRVRVPEQIASQTVCVRPSSVMSPGA